METLENQDGEQKNLSSLLEESDSGISSQEQHSILSQIEQMFDSGSAMEDIRELSYQPQKNGSLFPLLDSITVLLLTLAAAWLLFALHYQQEQSILSGGESVSSAEGTILREFRQETEEELQDLRSDLAALEKERDELSSRTEQIIERRTQEFEQELQTRMREERERLESSGVSRNEIENRLEQYREELTEQHSQELAAVRAEAEQKLEAREQQIEQLSQSYESRIEEYEGDRRTALQELDKMQARQQEAQLLSQQISSAYLSAINALENDNFESARQSLGVVEDLLTRDLVGSVPVTAQRLPADRQILSALSQFINLKESRQTDRISAHTKDELEELRQTISQQQEQLQAKDERIAELSESTENLTARLQNTRTELSQTQNRLGNARREVQNLRQVEERFRSRAQYFDNLSESLVNSAETLSGEQDNQEILNALDNKLEILQVLRSQTVRRQYPNMESLFTDYLDTFEQEYQRRGYLEALQDSRTLVETARQTAGPAEQTYFPRDRQGVPGSAAQLVEELELLVSP